MARLCMSPSVKILPVGAFVTPQRDWYQVSGRHDVYKNSIYIQKDDVFGTYHSATLYWNGKRWIAWVTNVLVAEPTEFTDRKDPPLDWAEGVLLLSLGD